MADPSIPVYLMDRIQDTPSINPYYAALSAIASMGVQYVRSAAHSRRRSGYRHKKRKPKKPGVLYHRKLSYKEKEKLKYKYFRDNPQSKVRWSAANIKSKYAGNRSAWYVKRKRKSQNHWIVRSGARSGRSFYK